MSWIEKITLQEAWRSDWWAGPTYFFRPDFRQPGHAARHSWLPRSSPEGAREGWLARVRLARGRAETPLSLAVGGKMPDCWDSRKHTENEETSYVTEASISPCTDLLEQHHSCWGSPLSHHHHHSVLWPTCHLYGALLSSLSSALSYLF